MLRLVVVTLFLAALFACSPPTLEETDDATTYSVDPHHRPNIIVIVVDDLRWDELGITGHPFLETPNIDELARGGALFSNAFHSVPLCSPNRACILTGQYPSRHGIIDNVARDRMSHRLETFPQALQVTGYETAFLGKWHMGNDPTPRPGFDYWVAIPGQGRTMNPELFEGGRIHEVPGYITDVLTDRAVDFIRAERSQPFFIYIGHKAIHPDAVQLDDGSVDLSVPRGYVPAPRHRGRYEEMTFPRRANNITSMSELDGKPALQHALTKKYSPEIVAEFGEEELDPGSSDETIRRRAEMLLAVDEGLGRIVTTLREEGVLDDTFILFTSDNGFFYGEHGLSLERRMPYEESIRTPLVIRFPPLIEPNLKVDDLVASVDIAPTVLEVAGAPVGDHIQGQSFLPSLMGSSAGTRASVFVEFFTYENPFPWLLDMDYRAIRTDRYKYIHWIQFPEWGELYDLQEDPLELKNLLGEPGMEDVEVELKEELRRSALNAMGLSG
ncbi:MAG: sulfatase [Gemmatimonadota bacterium]|jgi:N-acetylglucosamine-6-sulfatase